MVVKKDLLCTHFLSQSFPHFQSDKFWAWVCWKWKETEFEYIHNIVLKGEKYDKLIV